MNYKYIGPVILILILLSTSLCTEKKPNLTDEETGPWEDLNKFKSEINLLSHNGIEYVKNTKDIGNIKNPQKALYILPGLDKPLTGEDVLELKKLFDQGGKIILADDGNYTHLFVEIFGIHLWQLPYRPGWRYKSDWVENLSFIKAVGGISGKNYTVLIHRPLGINMTQEWRIILSLPHYATIELNNDGKESMGDAFFMIPPVAIELKNNVSGTILFISSSGIFTDNVFDELMNRDFVREYITSIVGPDLTVYFDDTKQVKDFSPHNVLLS